MWPRCCVAHTWMEMLDMVPTGYKEYGLPMQKLIFLGLNSEYADPTVQFNAKCLAFLMHKAHNDIRHGKTPTLLFGAGLEKEAKDWA